MFQITCPHCGPRNTGEFRFGGEVNARPRNPLEQEWAEYLYLRENRLGVQEEWWYHRQGCQRWFKLRRDTQTNQEITE
jgi:heterotetrameric sarcosine oxidase delta subunit